jgi:hypothetical protein
MTVKIGGKTYKGKYKGPDEFKGDQKKLDAYYAAQRATKNKAPAPAPKPSTPTPTAPVPQVNAPPAGGVSSNSSGNIQLQTNADIEGQALEAAEQLKQENERAAHLRAQSIIQEELGKKQAQDAYQQNRSRANQIMASRGMRGSAAQYSSDLEASNYQKSLDNVNAQKQAAITESGNIETAAKSWFDMQQGKLTGLRSDYTHEQSKENPTTGSSSVDSGLKPTFPYKAPAPATTAAAKVTPKPAAKPKFKGKYPGPDEFKGDKRKIAIWKASKRKAGKK